MLGRLRRRRGRAAVFKARAERPLAALGALDQALLRALRTRGHAPPVEAAVKGLGFAGEYGAVWMAIGATAAAADPARRSRWLAGSLVAPVAIVANFAVKKAVGRQRPVITEHPALAKAPSKLSFPSAHATSSAAAAVAFARVEPGARRPLTLLAAAICLGRPYLGMHYPSDVAAGVLLGTAIGRLAPLPGPSRGGFDDFEDAPTPADGTPLPPAPPSGP